MGPRAFLLVALAACQDPPEPEDTSPLPWEQEPARPLEPARLWQTLAVGEASAITRLRYDPLTATSFAVDPDADRVHLLDEVFRHTAEPRCIDPEELGEEAEAGWQGGCMSGLVELLRGAVRAQAPVDVAFDAVGRAAWVVTAGGGLVRVELGLESGRTLAWLRAEPAVNTGLAPGSAVWSGGLWLALEDEVVRVEEGRVVERLDWPGVTLLDGEGGLWALGPEGLRGPGDLQLPATAAAAVGGVGVAWSGGVLTWTDGAQAVLTPAPQALALDPRTGTAWALAEGQLWRVPPDGEAQAVLEAPGAQALGVTLTHEVLVAAGDGVSVIVDEQALEDPTRPPVYLSNLTFLETPHAQADRIICDGPRLNEALAHGLRRAAVSREALEDQPGAWGVAVTARFAEAVLHCGREHDFRPWTAWDVGVLFHDVSGCPDAACAQDWLEYRLGRLRAVGARPGWVAGLSEEEALDPMEALSALGLDRQLFWAAGMDPAILTGEPLWKQPWPLLPGEPGGALTLSSLGAWPEGDPDGAVALYPGNTLRGFALGACAGLLVQECLLLGRGSDTFDPSDALALGLLARHAAARRGAGVSAFTWHLPDLTAFDYSEGCLRPEPGRWEQDPSSEIVCGLGVLESILWDLQLSLVDNGVAAWSTPSALPWP